MVDMKRPLKIEDLVDVDNGVVDRAIFSDQEIYEMEMEQIFARAWNFMCHESQIPNTGDFFMNYIGEESVIATRDKEGQLQVLLNTCRHRGNAVCRAEQGHASSFMCTYHGWTYNLQGKLVGVPGSRDLYHGELDRDNWGLIRAPHVESYKGFVFANMDPDAPPLEEYLGEVGRIGLGMIAERGDMEVIDGIQKYVIGCNWKLAVDNLFDYYHVQVSHGSAMMVDWIRPRKVEGKRQNPVAQPPHLIMLGEYGHAIGGPSYVEDRDGDDTFMDQSWRKRTEIIEALGPVGVTSNGHPNIFPNLWVEGMAGNQICLRLPKGPLKTEMWWFTLIDKTLPADEWERQRRNAVHVFGPAGGLEQEDGENWDQSTRATQGVIARRYPLNYSMGLGHGEVVKDNSGSGHIVGRGNEHAQMWTYRAWADWMAAESWKDLKERHTPVPDIL